MSDLKKKQTVNEINFLLNRMPLSAWGKKKSVLRIVELNNLLKKGK